MPKADPQKEAHWRKMLCQQQSSDLTVGQFCREHGLKEASFFSWKREIVLRDGKAAGVTKNGRSTTASQAPQQQVSTSPFIPLRLNSEGMAIIELVHPRGHVLRIPACFDGDCLHKLLQLLDSNSET